MTRKVDELGRLVLPAELRASLGIESRDAVDIYTDDSGNIILHKSMQRCVFCNGTDGLIEVMGKWVCISCKETILKA